MPGIFKLKTKAQARRNAAKAAKATKAAAAAAFHPDGKLLSDGSVLYKILCDGGINSSGTFWSKTVAPGASTADYLAAQAERDGALKRLQKLTGAVK